jgi:hypothetical protein
MAAASVPAAAAAALSRTASAPVAAAGALLAHLFVGVVGERVVEGPLPRQVGELVLLVHGPGASGRGDGEEEAKGGRQESANPNLRHLNSSGDTTARPALRCKNATRPFRR